MQTNQFRVILFRKPHSKHLDAAAHFIIEFLRGILLPTFDPNFQRHGDQLSQQPVEIFCAEAKIHALCQAAQGEIFFLHPLENIQVSAAAQQADQLPLLGQGGDGVNGQLLRRVAGNVQQDGLPHAVAGVFQHIHRVVEEPVEGSAADAVLFIQVGDGDFGKGFAVGAFHQGVADAQTNDGLFMFSRFWLGKTMNPLLRKFVMTENMARGMAEHCYIEYRNLAQILPGLYDRFCVKK